MMLMSLGAMMLTTVLQAAPPTSPAPPATPEQTLRQEIDAMLEEMQQLRNELAQAKLDAAQAQRKLEELRQFIEDHDQYGDAFEEYRAVKEIKEREQRMKELEDARQRAEQARQERLERLREARERRAERRGEQREDEKYRRAGFEPVGREVYLGRMAYAYTVKDVNDVDITYDPFFGFYRRDDVRSEIDYTQMTISGSVVNGGDDIRNVGIAITFFDGDGNQVGHETVQINNARPDVPYPFTSRVDMALNDRAFSSSSAYVLYTDPVSTEPAEE